MTATPIRVRPGLGLIALTALALLSGCRVGPEVAVPPSALPSGWTGPTAPTAPAPDLSSWWTAFNDPALSALVEDALRANLDLRLASARLRQARAAHRVADAASGPTLDASAAARRSQAAAAAGSRASPTVNTYQAGFDAAWEIDLSGGVQRGREAAAAEVQAAVESRRDVQVSLVAEVARTYVELRTQQARIAIAAQNLEAQQRTVGLTRKRFANGFVGALDVATAEAQAATTAAQIPLLETTARQTLCALSVLLADEPATMLARLGEPGPVPLTPPAGPIGLPSDLLQRRPDIRGAEADSRAATARIGVATAELFPKVTIGAATGVQTASSADLLDPLSRFWSLGPSLSWRLFDRGRTLSQIAVQQALEEQSILTYRQTVLSALAEVESALLAVAKEQEHRASLALAAAASRRAVALAAELYAAGQSDYLEVLTAQRSLYSAEDALAQSSGNACTHLIALYKAVGGGWDSSAVAATSAP